MLEHRPFNTLGNHNYGWLNANYHFSFGKYHNVQRMRHGFIRVWNDDEIAPHTGFDRHPHRNMEIITYVRKGAITHKDSLGNLGKTVAGQVQVMSAGSGIFHEEQNMENETTELFQIWILPRAAGGDPFWATAEFPVTARSGAFQVLASGYAHHENTEVLPIRQDAAVYGATLQSGQTIDFKLQNNSNAYLVLASGEAIINGKHLKKRDGLAISNETILNIQVPDTINSTEIVLVETA